MPRPHASTAMLFVEELSRTGCAPTTAASKTTGREEAKRAFDEAILERLVGLNAERAAEEARGVVRWLRPAFQHPAEPAAPSQATLHDEAQTAVTLPALAAKPLAWPKDTVAQVRAVADALASSPVPLSVDKVAACFSGRDPWKNRLPQLLQMLEALGRAEVQTDRYSAIR